MSVVSGRNTKSEILSAYNALLKDHKNLEKDFTALKKQKATISAASGSTTTSNASSQTSATDISGIINGLNGLRAGLGISTSSLQQRLTTEATRLSDLRDEANTIINDLFDLHDIEEVTDKTLDDLVGTYKTLTENFNDELDTQRETANDDLEETSDAWKKDQDEHRQQSRERDANLKKTRERESAEYKYDLKQRLAASDDTYQLQQKAFKAELDVLKEDKDNAWTSREEDIAKDEEEFTKLQTKVDGLSAEKEKALKKAKDEGSNIAKRQAKIKKDLLDADIQGKENVSQLKVTSLEATIEKNNTLIQDGTQQLRTAQRQAQELAVKAIEGASNERSFLAVKEIALEQAKTPQKGK